MCQADKFSMAINRSLYGSNLEVHNSRLSPHCKELVRKQESDRIRIESGTYSIGGDRELHTSKRVI